MSTEAQELSAAVETAMRRVLGDDTLRKAFWKAGYEELSAHAINSASQWVGKRILMSIVWALVGAGLVWLAKNGAWK